MSFQEIITYAIADITFNGFLYFIFAIPVFLMFWVFGKKYFKARRIQEKKRSNSKQINREIFFSMLSLSIFMLVDIGLFVAAENGYTLPGMTIVCGDSHTSTHGAFGTIAFGIGTSEVEMVLASQCLLQPKPKTMLIKIEGCHAKHRANPRTVHANYESAIVVSEAF